MSIERIHMPTKEGREIINPFRYVCNFGHVHPSHRHAVKCHARERKAQEKRAAREAKRNA